jgi:ABC-type transporter MlaC component
MDRHAFHAAVAAAVLPFYVFTQSLPARADSIPGQFAQLAAANPAALILEVGTKLVQLAPLPINQKVAGLDQVFRDSVDMNAIGTIVMGSYLRQLTSTQKDDFFRSFDRYTKLSLSKQIEAFSGCEFKVGRVVPLNEETRVFSTITRPGGTPVEVVWYLSGGKIFDVSINGERMAVTGRQTVADIINRNNGQAASINASLHQEIERMSGEMRPRSFNAPRSAAETQPMPG